jgi:hypothetical protein
MVNADMIEILSIEGFKTVKTTSPSIVTEEQH